MTVNKFLKGPHAIMCSQKETKKRSEMSQYINEQTAAPNSRDAILFLNTWWKEKTNFSKLSI